MVGVVLLVLAFLVGIPGFLMTMGVIGGLIGKALTDDAEERFAGSELVELNK